MEKPALYLFEFVKKKVDLSELLEDLGCQLFWMRGKESAKCLCPIPSHKDGIPSFHVTYLEEDGLWVYKCYGCGAKGTIIDFFMDYYSIPTPSQAVIAICNKYGFKEGKDLAIECLRDVKKKANLQKKIEYSHIVTANQCRMLLRKDYDRFNKWVAASYKKMDKALDLDDINTIESIGFEASRKMMEVNCG
jgi:hypothetical protein